MAAMAAAMEITACNAGEGRNGSNSNSNGGNGNNSSNGSDAMVGSAMVGEVAPSMVAP